MSREQLLARTFVELADTLVDDFDVIEFLHALALRSVELLDVSAAGIMMADQRGGLHVVAASTEEARLLESYELQNVEGPCLDAFNSGEPVTVSGLDEMAARWPAFTPRLRELGFSSAQAIPLRLRRQTIGALNLFGTGTTSLSEDDMALGRALADVATIGLLQERSVSAGEVLAEQLQTALSSRVILEQAKGVLAERGGLEMGSAFEVLRTYARRHGRKLVEVATEVIAGRLDVLADARATASNDRATRH